MADISRLGIEVTSTGIDDAISKLEKLAERAEQVEKKVDNLSKKKVSVTVDKQETRSIEDAGKATETAAESKKKSGKASEEASKKAQDAAAKEAEAARKAADAVAEAERKKSDAFVQSARIRAETFNKSAEDSTRIIGSVKGINSQAVNQAAGYSAQLDTARAAEKVRRDTEATTNAVDKRISKLQLENDLLGKGAAEAEKQRVLAMGGTKEQAEAAALLVANREKANKTLADQNTLLSDQKKTREYLNGLEYKAASYGSNFESKNRLQAIRRGMSPEAVEEAAAIGAYQDAEKDRAYNNALAQRRQNGISKQIDKLNRQTSTFWQSSGEKAESAALASGATQSQAKEIRELTEKAELQKKIKSIMEEGFVVQQKVTAETKTQVSEEEKKAKLLRNYLGNAQAQADTAGMSRAEKGRYRAAKLGASEEDQQRAYEYGALTDERILQGQQDRARKRRAEREVYNKQREDERFQDRINTMDMDKYERKHYFNDKKYKDSDPELHEKNRQRIIAVQKASEEAGHHGAGAWQKLNAALEKMGLTTARSRAEMIVLAHEAVQGTFSRMPGSLMVLAEQANVATVAMGLFTHPVVIGATALIGLGAAMHTAYEESHKLSVALAGTSNFAGMSQKSFEGLANQLSESGELTRNEASDLALSLVAAGKYSKEQIETISKGILDFATLTRTDVEDARKTLMAAFRDPYSAAKDLNEQFHFLTASEIEQVRQMTELGQKTEATELVMSRYHDKLGTVATGSVNTLTKAWNGLVSAIENAAKATGTFLLNPVQSMKEAESKAAIKKLKGEIDILEQKRDTALKAKNGDAIARQQLPWLGGFTDNDARQLNILKTQLSEYEKIVNNAESRSKAGIELAAKEEQKKYDNTIRANKALELAASRRTRLEQANYEIKLLKSYYYDEYGVENPELLNRFNGDKKAMRADFDRNAKDIMERKGPKPGRQLTSPENTRSSVAEEKFMFEQEMDVLLKRVEFEREISGYVNAQLLSQKDILESHKKSLDLKQRIRSIDDSLKSDAEHKAKGGKGGLTQIAVDELNRQRASMIALKKSYDEAGQYREKSVSELSEEVTGMQAVSKLIGIYKSQLDELNAVKIKEIELNTEMSNNITDSERFRNLQTDTQANRIKEITKLKGEEEAITERLKLLETQRAEVLEKMRNAKPAEQSSYASYVRKLEREISELTQKRSVNQRNQSNTYTPKTSVKGDIDLGNMWDDSVKGWNEAFKQFETNSMDIYKNVQSLGTEAIGGLSNSIANFVTTGKAGFNDWKISILKAISQVITQMLVVKAIQTGLNFLGGLAGGAAAGTAAGAASGVTAASVGSFSAASAGSIGAASSGVWSGAFPTTAFAKGGAFTNGVVDSSTIVPMAEMGEAGPEAVMPLTRDSTGRLAVTSVGKGDSSQIQNNISITINSDGSSETSSDTSGQDSRKMAEALANRVRQIIVEEQRPGGSLYR